MYKLKGLQGPHRTSLLSRRPNLVRSPCLSSPSRLTTRSADTGSQVPSPSPTDIPSTDQSFADATATSLKASDTRVSATPAPKDLSPSPEPLEGEPEAVSSHPLSEEPEEQDDDDFIGSRELAKEIQTGFGNRGEAWSLASIVGLAMVVFCPFKLTGLVDMLGTLTLTAGIVFMVYALISLGRNFSPLPLPRKRHALITTGMYSYVRHPMYGALLLVALGLACLTRSETRLAMGALLWWILEQKVAMEERALSELYPSQYAQYKDSVKKFVPFVY